jgi:hypothetical protein
MAEPRRGNVTAAQRAQLERMTPVLGKPAGRFWYPYGASEWAMARRMRDAGLISRSPYGGGFGLTEAGRAAAGQETGK